MFFFFFNDTATTEIYTLSLHDALPISDPVCPRPASAQAAETRPRRSRQRRCRRGRRTSIVRRPRRQRSEEHTSELQSRLHLVCRLLLEKKKKKKNTVLRYEKQRSQPSA